MSFNKKHIALLSIALTLVWIFNVISFISYRLDKPLFLPHILEINNGDRFYLNFVQDKYEKDKVQYIKLPQINKEIPISYDDDMHIHPWFSRYENIFYEDKKYAYLSAQIDLLEDGHILDLKNDILIENIVYETQSGKQYIDKESKIHIKANKDTKEGSLLKDMGSTGESFVMIENKTKSFYETKEDIILTKCDPYFPYYIWTYFNIKVNGKPLTEKSFPMKFKKGEMIEVETCFDVKNHFYYLSFYNLKLNLIFENSKGDKQTISEKLSSGSYFQDIKGDGKVNVKNFINLRGMKNGQTL